MRLKHSNNLKVRCMRMSLSVNTKNTFFASPLFMYAGFQDWPINNTTSNKHFFQKRHPHAPNHLFKKASYTVEAAVIMPVFLYVCVTVLIFFGVLQKEWDTKVFISDSVRNAAVYGSVLPDDFSLNIGLINVDEKNIEITAMYPVQMPLDFFGLGGMTVTEKAKARRWVGYDPKEDSKGDGNTVYVTESGQAYHNSLECTYLKLSISVVSADEVSNKRNASGGKYKACPLCRGSSTSYYITTYGDCYHTSLGCSGLKRTIRSESREQAIEEGYHACSKCAKGE